MKKYVHTFILHKIHVLPKKNPAQRQKTKIVIKENWDYNTKSSNLTLKYLQIINKNWRGLG